MGPARIIGIALLALGIVLLVFGLTATNSVMERVLKNVTGEYTNQTMWYIIGGVVCAVVGVALTFAGGRREA
jgi:hypothetical protein